MANFIDMYGISIPKAFKQFIRKNKKIKQLVWSQAYRATSRGFMFSFKEIINYIRWHVKFDVDTKDTYKINDAFAPHFARLFIKEHPEYEDLIEVRELRDGSEVGTARINEGYRIGILEKMRDGARLVHLRNNTVYFKMMGRSKKITNVTTVSFNKMIRDKYITRIDHSENSDEYVISKKGLAFIANLPPVKKKVAVKAKSKKAKNKKSKARTGKSKAKNKKMKKPVKSSYSKKTLARAERIMADARKQLELKFS